MLGTTQMAKHLGVSQSRAVQLCKLGCPKNSLLVLSDLLAPVREESVVGIGSRTT